MSKQIIVEITSDSGKVYNTREKNARLELKVINRAEKGELYSHIAKKLKIKKRKAMVIAQKHGIRRNKKFDTPKNRQLVTLINKDIDEGLPYKELVIKYNLDLALRGRLKRIGLNPITKKYKSVRDQEITNQYKNKIAKKVLISEEKELNSPKRITSEHNIYAISSENGFKKFPKIGNRNKGGCFEDKKIIRYIVKKRDKDEWCFGDIAKKLNKLGKTTVTGKPFTWYLVIYKYKHYKKLRGIKVERKRYLEK